MSLSIAKRKQWQTALASAYHSRDWGTVRALINTQAGVAEYTTILLLVAKQTRATAESLRSRSTLDSTALQNLGVVLEALCSSVELIAFHTSMQLLGHQDAKAPRKKKKIRTPLPSP